MTKLIKKKDCKFKHCQIVKGDELIGIPTNVWLQLNRLETMYQQFCYLKKQPSHQAGPSLEGFMRKSMVEDNMPYIDAPETPVTDARVKEAMAFMAEVDAVSNAADANKMLDRNKDLVLWCDNKKFVEGNCLEPIDTPFLGNPLELKGKHIAKLLMKMASSPIAIES